MIDPRARARATAIAAAVIGLIVATAVVGYFNVGAVLAAMRPIGVAGFIAVIAAQLALFVPLGLAWWLVAPGETSRRAPVFAWSRLVREAASDVLPFSQLGGLVIAARAVVLGGTPTAVAFGSSLVDVTIEIVAQLIYTLVGVALLAHRLGFAARGDRLLFSLVLGLVIAAALVGVMIATQRRGLTVIERLFHRLAPAAGRHATAVNKVVEAAYGKRPQLWESLGLHVFAWFGAAGGTWLILVLISRPLPFASVAAIESLLFAIRNAAFMVPSGLGVQEGAYALLGPLFGLPVEAALALSLLKRARDIAVGVPMLLSWQLLESRRRLRDSRSSVED
jgi:putative membrane protein